MARNSKKRKGQADEQPIAQNGDPPRVEDSQGHQAKRKRQLEAELEEAIGDLDEVKEDLMEAHDEIADLRFRNGEQEAEIERLRAQVEQQGPQNNGGDLQPEDGQLEAPHPPNAPPKPSDAEKEAVRVAGRRCCVLHQPWMQGDSLFDTEVRNNFDSIITHLESIRQARNDAGSDSEEEDPVEQFWRSPRFEVASPVDVAREVMSHMSLALAKKWFEAWFRSEFRIGMRKMGAEAVSEIANHRHIVFGMTDEQFGQRNQERKRGPGAKALYEDDAFLWQPDDEDDPKPLVERFMRSDVLVRAVKLLMTSASSVQSEQRSAQARAARIHMWHVKTITPSILSFVAITVRFVLSGDSTFDKVTPSANYMEVYDANLCLLQTQRTRHRRHYNELITLYNQQLLPDIYRPSRPVEREFAGMSNAAKEFYQSMQEPTGSEDGGED